MNYKQAYEKLRVSMSPLSGAEEALIERGFNEKLARLEGMVHELSHAAVFDFKSLERYSLRVSQRYDFMVWNPRTADESECKTLATERCVYDRLGWPISGAMWENVLTMAAEDMRLYSTHRVFERYRNALAMKVTQKRASQVIRWIEIIAKRRR